MTRMTTLWWKVIGGWYQHHENTSFVKQTICGLIESPYKNELIHACGLLALSQTWDRSIVGIAFEQV